MQVLGIDCLLQQSVASKMIWWYEWHCPWGKPNSVPSTHSGLLSITCNSRVPYVLISLHSTYTHVYTPKQKQIYTYIIYELRPNKTMTKTRVWDLTTLSEDENIKDRFAQLGLNLKHVAMFLCSVSVPWKTPVRPGRWLWRKVLSAKADHLSSSSHGRQRDLTPASCLLTTHVTQACMHTHVHIQLNKSIF